MFQLVQHRARSRAPRKVEGGLDALQPNGNLGLSVRQEVEDRLSTLRDRMAAIRQGDKAALQRSYRNGSELHGSVLWCDSDPEVASCADVLRGSGLALRTFTEPEALLEAYDAFPQDVLCIMSSMMEGNGRKERGAMNAFGLFSAIRSRVKATEGLEQPLLAVISCSADENAARAAGAEIVVFGSRAKAQNLVALNMPSERIEATRTSLNALEHDVAGLKTKLNATPASQESVEELKVVVKGFQDRLESAALKDEVTHLSERVNALIAAQFKKSGGQRQDLEEEFENLAATLQKDEEAESVAHTRLLLRIDELCRNISKATDGGANDWVGASGVGSGGLSATCPNSAFHGQAAWVIANAMRDLYHEVSQRVGSLVRDRARAAFSDHPPLSNEVDWHLEIMHGYEEAQPWNEEDDNPWEAEPVDASACTATVPSDAGTLVDASPSPCQDEAGAMLHFGTASAGTYRSDWSASTAIGKTAARREKNEQDQGTSMTPILAERAVASPLSMPPPSTSSAAVQATDFVGEPEFLHQIPKEPVAEDLVTKDSQAQTEPVGPRKLSKSRDQEPPRLQRTQKGMPDPSKRQSSRWAMKDNGLPTVLKDLAQTVSARRHSKETVGQREGQGPRKESPHKEGAQSRHQNPRPQGQGPSGPSRVASADAKDRPLSIFAKRQAGQSPKEEEPAKPKSATPSREERSPDRQQDRQRQDHASSAPAQRGRQSNSPKTSSARRSRSDADTNRDKDLPEVDLFQIPEQLREVSEESQTISRYHQVTEITESV
ncbi:unnamed protein product, partial [Symbiodinium microadriaticum]